MCGYASTQVQATNDSSVASKRCMAEAGYFDDPFLSHFTPKRSRTALINRCAVAVCPCMPVLLVIVSHSTLSYNWYVQCTCLFVCHFAEATIFVLKQLTMY